MNDSQKLYFIVMSEAPENSIIRISSSSEELHEKLHSIKRKEENNGYNLSIILTPSNKKLLISFYKKSDFIEDIHYFQLQVQGEIIFKAYDGFEIGEVVKESALHNKLDFFIKKKMCALILNG